MHVRHSVIPGREMLAVFATVAVRDGRRAAVGRQLLSRAALDPRHRRLPVERAAGVPALGHGMANRSAAPAPHGGVSCGRGAARAAARHHGARLSRNASICPAAEAGHLVAGRLSTTGRPAAGVAAQPPRWQRAAVRTRAPSHGGGADGAVHVAALQRADLSRHHAADVDLRAAAVDPGHREILAHPRFGPPRARVRVVRRGHAVRAADDALFSRARRQGGRARAFRAHHWASSSCCSASRRWAPPTPRGACAPNAS